MPLRHLTAPTAVAVLCGLASLCGCAPLAKVSHWQPAAIDVRGLNRVAVVDFRGEQGREVAAALNSRLWENRFYSLVDASELTPVQHAAYTPCQTDERLLHQARERGIDGVIVGEVVAYRCDDEILKESEIQLSEQSRAPASHERSPLHVGFTHRERIHREATVAVTFRLVDAQTGEVRASRETSHHFSGESPPDGTPLPPRGEVLTTLTDMCLDDFIAQLAPHQVECDVKLARGRWLGTVASDIRTGNRLAAAGDWDGARDRWQAAVDRNPECDAALFNLALDAVHRQQYAAAEDLAMRAIRLKHTDRYAEGLESIRQYRTGYEAVQQQRDSRVLQASSQLAR